MSNYLIDYCNKYTNPTKKLRSANIATFIQITLENYVKMTFVCELVITRLFSLSV